MIKYIKDSIRELRHVVWPTKKETNNYFLTVILVLIAFGIYLFIASTIFTKLLFGLKDIVDNNKSTENNFILPESEIISDDNKEPTIKIKNIDIKADANDVVNEATK